MAAAMAASLSVAEPPPVDEPGIAANGRGGAQHQHQQLLQVARPPFRVGSSTRESSKLQRASGLWEPPPPVWDDWDNDDTSLAGALWPLQGQADADAQGPAPSDGAPTSWLLQVQPHTGHSATGSSMLRQQQQQQHLPLQHSCLVPGSLGPAPPVAGVAVTPANPSCDEVQARWHAADKQVTAFEQDVASRMAGYLHHRARVEAEIQRRQEARVLGAPSTRTAQHGSKGGGSSSDRAAGAGAGSSTTRALLRLSSQHDSSEVSAYTAVQVPLAQLLAPPDVVREARAQVMQVMHGLGLELLEAMGQRAAA